MSKMVILHACVLLIGVFVSAVSQVMLKMAALKKYDSVLYEYLNPMVIMAYVLFVGTTILAVIAYKGIPLSMGPILESTSYFYIVFFGVKIFHERINVKKVLALLLIVGGIIIYAVWG